MDKKVIDGVLSRLDTIGEKMGQGADYFWPYYIRQEYVDAFFATIILVIMVMLLLAVIHYIYKKRKYIEENNIEAIAFWVAVIVTILFIASAVVWFKQFPDIFNPEYEALSNLISQMR